MTNCHYWHKHTNNTSKSLEIKSNSFPLPEKFKLKAYYQNIDTKSTKELKTGQRINEKKK